MSERRTGRGGSRAAPPGFTLVELLVVIGIISVLVAVLLPVLAGARRSAQDVACRSNMRQVCLALINYATEHKGRFPPNINTLVPRPPTGPKWNAWYDAERLGRYLPYPRTARFNWPNCILSPVMACPADDRASVSYAMNYWASCLTNTNAAETEMGVPDWAKAGKAWGLHTRKTDKLILIVESLSFFPDGWGAYLTWPIVATPNHVTAPATFRPGPPFIGLTPGAIRFHGGSGEIRYTPADCLLDWSRHRRRGDGGTRVSESRGRANIGFGDGHVESYRADDLVDRNTHKSKLVALWSPLDPFLP